MVCDKRRFLTRTFHYVSLRRSDDNGSGDKKLYFIGKDVHAQKIFHEHVYAQKSYKNSYNCRTIIAHVENDRRQQKD